MKIIFFISVLSFLFVISCKDNSVNTTNNNPASISGKIENWHLGSNKYVVAYAQNPGTMIALDSSSIDVYGNFSLNLLIPPDSILRIIDFFDSLFCFGNVNLNPNNSKFTYISFQVHNGNPIGLIQLSSDSFVVHTGKVDVWYTYVDHAGTISGQDSCNFYGYIKLESYNINYSKGFNYWYVKYNEYDTNYVNDALTSTKPQDVRWYYFLIQYKSRFVKK